MALHLKIPLVATATVLALGTASVPTPASAEIVTVAVILETVAGTIIDNLVQQFVNGNRGAAAVACVEAKCVSDSKNRSWFGSAVATASAADAFGTADANAHNSLSTQTVVPTDGTGIFAAKAAISWKGVVVDQHSASGPGLPKPSDVLGASYSAFWNDTIDGIGFGYPNSAPNSSPHYSGALGVDLSIDGVTVFTGGATAVRNKAVFTGNLIPYASQFTVDGGLSASNLQLSGTFNAPLDYAAFYANPQISVDVGGSAYAQASGTPEPSTWALMLLGLGGLWHAGSRRNRREAFAA